MSHIVTVRTEVRDAEAVLAACERLKLPPAKVGTAELYEREVMGLLVELPGWRYPVAIQMATGEVEFDNFGGRWGEQRELDRFLQAYAVEKAMIEAGKQGYTVREESLADGSIRLEIAGIGEV